MKCIWRCHLKPNCIKVWYQLQKLELFSGFTFWFYFQTQKMGIRKLAFSFWENWMLLIYLPRQGWEQINHAECQTYTRVTFSKGEKGWNVPFMFKIKGRESVLEHWSEALLQNWVSCLHRQLSFKAASRMKSCKWLDNATDMQQLL